MIENKAVEQLLQQGFPGAEITVEGDGYHYHLTMVSEQFLELSKVKRQQSVYAVLQSCISQGDLHALTMKTYTPTEWESEVNG